MEDFMATRRNNDTRPAKSSASAAGAETVTEETAAAQAAAKRPSRSRTPTAPKTQRTETQAEARVAISPEERRALIAESAYLRAERRGFGPGYEVEDWLAAEREIDALLNSGSGAPQ
jgi:hypothetical protein